MLSHGGEVWRKSTELLAGQMQERLVMSIALPFLWGVPPAYDSLRWG